MQRDATTELLKRAKSGSDADLDLLFRRYAGKLLAWIRLRLGAGLRRRIESRDVLQNVLLKAFQRVDGLRGTDGESLMGWLVRIADNEIRDQADFHGRARRDARREVPLDGLPEALVERTRSATGRIALDERTRRLECALELLTPDHREVIVLRRLEELSYREIADRLGRSEDACRMLFGRAMAALTAVVGEGRAR